jgi:hypothetical protein
MNEIRVQSIGRIILTGKIEMPGLTEHIPLCYNPIEEKEVSRQPQHNLYSLL